MQHAVLAILSGREQSVRCADRLKEAGFTRDEISILMPDDFGAEELGFERKSKAGEAIAIGMITGWIVGFAFGYMADAQQAVIPGLQFLFQAGNLTAALATAGLASSVAGLIAGLIGLTMTQYVARKYDRKARFGTSLLSVHVSNKAETKIAEKILSGEGASDVNVADERIEHRKQPQLSSR